MDFEEDVEEDDECSGIDRPAKEVVVTPFLSRVLPAGTLRGKPKPAGTKATGLIQVGLKLLVLYRIPLNVFLSWV